jgi:hypothetical protein
MTTNAPSVPAYMRAQTPHDTLMTAISILQMKALAEDSCCDGPGIWGLQFMESGALEHAIGLLIGILPDVENLPAHEVKA